MDCLQAAHATSPAWPAAPFPPPGLAICAHRIAALVVTTAARLGLARSSTSRTCRLGGSGGGGGLRGIGGQVPVLRRSARGGVFAVLLAPCIGTVLVGGPLLVALPEVAVEGADDAASRRMTKDGWVRYRPSCPCQACQDLQSHRQQQQPTQRALHRAPSMGWRHILLAACHVPCTGNAGHIKQAAACIQGAGGLC
jgi:hypothetical protein